jgi:arylsulfatase A-like enzyme
MIRRMLMPLAALPALLVLPPARAEGPTRYNVLFLMSDDLRPELGCYGKPVRTPNIDALAAAGVRFERAYCQYPLCNPSRTSMLTGRHPRTTGVLDNQKYFRAAHPDFVTLPQHFKAHGYAALRTGKVFHGGIDDVESWTEGGEPLAFNGAVKPVTPQRREQSDRIIVLEGDGADAAESKVADRAIDYLRRYKDRPFFLACGFSKPHSPPTAPKRFFDLYDPATVALPADFASRPTVPPGFPTPSIPLRNADLFIGRDASPEAAREMIRAYWASLTWVDHNVGRVVAELDKLGLRDRTVIVFWGDHGYHLGEKGKWSKAHSLWEVGTRIPVIVTAPGANGNGRPSARLIQAIDFYPTLVELAGLPKPDGLEGRSLVPLLADPDAPWPYPAFTTAGTLDKPAIAVRTDRWRFAEWDGGRGGSMLLDHANDPGETKNLADDPAYASVKAELSALAKTVAPPGRSAPSTGARPAESSRPTPGQR